MRDASTAVNGAIVLGAIAAGTAIGRRPADEAREVPDDVQATSSETLTMAPPDPKHRRSSIGVTAVAFSALYLLSNVIEAIHGAFSAGQLWLTLVAEAAIPVFVIGLYVARRPQIGRLGRVGALAHAYSYVFFTATVVYALIDATRDFDALARDLHPWMTIHGAIMVLAGLCFGGAVIGAGVPPRWTAIALMTGVVVVAVAVSQGLPEAPQLVAAAIRDLAFAGMGAALLGFGAVRRPRPTRSGRRMQSRRRAWL